MLLWYDKAVFRISGAHSLRSFCTLDYLSTIARLREEKYKEAAGASHTVFYGMTARSAP